VVYSIRHEMAVTIEDVLARRIGLQLFSWRDAIRAAPVVGEIFGKELEWSDERVMAETNGYIRQINRLLEVAGLALQNASKNSE
jgi:glycerol-3-phosphate dehydrogenase